MSMFTLESATNFFAPVKQSLLAANVGDTDATPQSAFKTSDTGLMSIILAQPTVPEAVQKELDTQRQNLIDLTGVASAFVRKTADQKKDPNLVYDTLLWQSVFNHLPLMGPSQFINQTFSQNLKGIEIAEKFVATVLGVATAGGPALASFASFLNGLGTSIRAGFESGTKSYSVGAISIVLEGQQVGNEIKINPWLKGYFIDFVQEQKKIYSSCGSAESFFMSFNYRTATSLFNYGALRDSTVRSKYETFIRGTQIDDIKTADNFFNGTFDTK